MAPSWNRIAHRSTGPTDSTGLAGLANLADLADSRRILLTTYGPDAAPHRRLCRVVADGAALGIVLGADSPEADRIRRCRGVLVQACDGGGTPTGPQWRARATARNAGQTVDYRIALVNKYGLAAAVALAVHRLRSGLDGTVGVRLTPAARDWPLLGPTWRPGAAYNPN
ncbi:PPOX class F420-dependent oxidoreductase [Streptacidiphilus sp. N1-12]|uniref:PPOX class F420-dependent oxidoreductase n=2 Tax=Streptacidiphilus alkalitolerans TaxID=3342712 RepID=A0ABV6W9H6_9ACTN